MQKTVSVNWTAGISRNFQGGATVDILSRERYFNAKLDTYPSNQVYSIHKRRLCLSRKLARRALMLERYFPEHITSFLDIGCAQGYFVLDVARRFPESRSQGIDVDRKYIQTGIEISEYLRLKNARFLLSHIGDLNDALEANGGPFQVVLFLNTYHYIYCGSEKDRFGYYNHDRIFSILRRLTCSEVIFSSPLKIDDCPGYVQEHVSRSMYNPGIILASAEKLFTIEKVNNLGKRPLFILRVRPDSEIE